MTTDIFADTKETVAPTWASFKNPGDAVHGTYIGKIVGQRDGYGNEQVIYQLLQKDGSIVNVGFGLNKKFIIMDMDKVNFGQIVGFKFKGTISVKNKVGQMVDVKDYGLHQDPKIVDEVWLKENKDSMPAVVKVEQATEDHEIEASRIEAERQFADNGPTEKVDSTTEEDKLKVIEKLAKDKLGAIDLETTKTKVMETLKVAFIPLNFDEILEKLTAM
jgi:hypothetical protein